MERIDDSAEERYVKACVYGRSGTGKTSLGVTAPKPLILASERQAMLSVRQAAKRLGVTTAPPALFMESLEDYRSVLRGLKAGPDEHGQLVVRDGPMGEVILRCEFPETVVVDSVTDAARMVAEEIYDKSPAPLGKDGLPAPTMRHWGLLGDSVSGLVRAFRDVPANVLFLALADDREDDDKRRTVTPTMPMRKLSESLCAACNLVGYSYRSQAKDGSPVFGTMFTGPEAFMLKTTSPIRDRERSNFQLWHAAIFGGLELSETPPQLSAESLNREETPAADEAAKPSKKTKKEAANAES